MVYDEGFKVKKNGNRLSAINYQRYCFSKSREQAHSYRRGLNTDNRVGEIYCPFTA